MLRAFCLKLEIKEFRCYEVKIDLEESEKAGSCREPNSYGGLLGVGGCPAVVAQWQNTDSSRGVLGSTPGDCQPLHFSPHNI